MATKQYWAEFSRLSSNGAAANGEEATDGPPPRRMWPSGGIGRWCKVGCHVATALGLLALLFYMVHIRDWASGGTVPGNAPGSNQFKNDYAKAIELLENRAGPRSPWALMDRTRTHVLNKDAHGMLLRQHKELPHLPDGDTNRSLLKLNLFEKRMRETVTGKYIRVSTCWVDSSLVALKIAAAIQSLESAIIVCPSVSEAASGRRLVGEPIGRAGIRLRPGEQKEMACVGETTGVVANLAQVSQYLSAALASCPFEPPEDLQEKAECAEFISILTAGAFKTSAALSDVKTICSDPNFSNYTRPIKKGKEMLVKSTCLVNIGQATSYLANAGLSLDGLQKACSQPGVLPNDGKKFDPKAQAKCGAAVSGELTNILLTATYLAGAAAGCGETIIIPSLCSLRITSSLAGLAYITEAGFGIRETCTNKA